MKTTLTLAALLSGLASTPALAQGGFYVGALGGYEGIHVKSADGTASAKRRFDRVRGRRRLRSQPRPSLRRRRGRALDQRRQHPLPEQLHRRAATAWTPTASITLAPAPAWTVTPGHRRLWQGWLHLARHQSLDLLRPAVQLKDMQRHLARRGVAGAVAGRRGPPTTGRSSYKDVASGTYGDATTGQVVAGLGVRF